MSSSSQYPHIVWAVGHFTLLTFSLWFFIPAITLHANQYAWRYRAAYVGALTSYAIVCYKSLGRPQPTKAYLYRALSDENVQYFLLAMYWMLSRPVSLSLIPYAVFSLFHALTFTRTNILPKLSPPPAAPAQGSQQQAIPPASGLSKTIHAWVKKNYDPAMSFVSAAELILLGRLLLGLLFFQNSILTLIFYVHFLRARYYFSPFTRAIVDAAVVKADSFVGARNEPWLKRGYEVAKLTVEKWAKFILPPPSSAGPAAQPAPASAPASASTGAASPNAGRR